MAVNLEKIKGPKLKNKKSNLNREREFAVVLESLRSDFRIFGEGLSAVREKVYGLSDKVDGLSDRVGLLSGRVGGLSGQVGSLSDRVNAIFEMTGKNTEDISAIKSDIRIIKTILKNSDKRISFIEERLPAS